MNDDDVTQSPLLTRKSFLSGALAAPAVLRSAAPNDLLGLGIIGTGTRGGDLVKDVVKASGAKLVAVCDVYKPHVEKAVKLSGNPDANRYVDYRDLLADRRVDAVIVATPDHWHSKMLIDAVEAGKDVYMEKGWTRTVAEAKAMRAAVKRSNAVMQLGHQGRQYASAIQARELIQQGLIGDVSIVRTGRCGNSTPEKPTWRWYGYYSQFERPDPEQVKRDLNWDLWLGPAGKIPFSMERFWHWRCYWAYGTGVAGDLLSHELDFVQSVLGYGIPDTCISCGAINLLKDGREVPDTTSATYQFEKQNCTVTFFSTMNSAVPGQAPEFRGRYGTIQFNRIGQDANDFQVLGDRNGGRHPEGVIRRFDPAATPPQPSHMQDFIDSVRARRRPKCNEDEAFIEAVTFIMSVAAYREKRMVRWDRDKEEIV
jgi:predicted dehydrogenase